MHILAVCTTSCVQSVLHSNKVHRRLVKRLSQRVMDPNLMFLEQGQHFPLSIAKACAKPKLCPHAEVYSSNLYISLDD